MLSAAVFVFTQIAALVARVREERRQSAERIFRVVESAARNWLIPPEAAFAMAVPGIYSALPRGDSVVASWIVRQLQLMMLARSRSESLEIVVRMSVLIAEWVRGTRSRRWFREAVTLDPPLPDFVVPNRKRFVRMLNDSRRWWFLAGLVATGVLAARQLIRT